LVFSQAITLTGGSHGLPAAAELAGASGTDTATAAAKAAMSAKARRPPPALGPSGARPDVNAVIKGWRIAASVSSQDPETMT
jgi:hypothetical protein